MMVKVLSSLLLEHLYQVPTYTIIEKAILFESNLQAA
jgi:hypothetical protein